MLAFLSLRSFRNRKFVSLLSILSISLSLSLFLVINKLRHGVEEGFSNTISQADLIVGARSAPLQLLLYSIFHKGEPTNNISFESYQTIKSSRAIEWTIPISLGDSYRGHRVVGTNPDFFKYYQYYGDKHLKLSSGKWSDGVFDVVIGSAVKNLQNLKEADPIVLSHGISEKSVIEHDKTPFKITGILEPTGTPIDRALFISLKGVEALHVGWENGVPSYDQESTIIDETKLKTTSITSFIAKAKSRFALLHLQREISTMKSEPLTAIIPALTLTQLWSLLDQVELILIGISIFVVIIGFFSVLISLYMSLNGRKNEMAILRSLGVSPFKITGLLLVDATILSIAGAILGFVFQYLLVWSLKPMLESQYGVYIQVGMPELEELYVILFFVCLGPLSGFIPGVKAYYTSLHTGLSNKS